MVQCIRCSKAGKFQCSKCKQVSYCSKECQVEHWKAGHKTQCGTLQNQSTGFQNIKKEYIVGVLSEESKQSKEQIDKWLFSPNSEKEKLFTPPDLRNFMTFDGSLVPPGIGLENLGNTCYLNSVLQVLVYTRPLANYFTSPKDDTHFHLCSKLNKSETEFCPICMMADLSKTILQPNMVGHLRPIPWIRNISKFGDFHFFRQEDAHEFLGMLLNRMQSRFVDLTERKEGKRPDIMRSDTTLINEIFTGYYLNQTRCNRCATVYLRHEPFVDISLGLTSGNSVEEALNSFTTLEHIEEDTWVCEKCEKKAACQKQITLYKSPGVLTVQLKRFDYMNNGIKIHKSIICQEILSLKGMVAKDSPEYNQDLDYELYAVIVHYGENIFSGHYVAFVKVANNWYLIDDTEIKPVSASVVLKQSAYLLFYRNLYGKRNTTGPSKTTSNVKVANEISISSTSRKSDIVIKTPTYAQYMCESKEHVNQYVLKIFTPLLIDVNEAKFTLQQQADTTKTELDVKDIYNLKVPIPFLFDHKKSQVKFMKTHGVIYAIFPILTETNSSSGTSSLPITIETSEEWQNQFEQELGDPLPDLTDDQPTASTGQAAQPTKNLETATYRKLLNETKDTSASSTHQISASSQTKFNTSKIGRNDKCPCGSGKKFKSCHYGK